MPKREMAAWQTLVRQASDLDVAPNREARIMPLSMIEANPWQPRQHTDAARMEELAADIKARGILQPIVVRPIADGRFQVIVGERRYQAARRLKLETVPVIVKEIDDTEARAVSLVENLQREDLDIEDEARFLKALSDQGFSLREIAAAIHKSHNYVQRRLRLLETPGALTRYRAGLLNLDELLAAEPEPPTDVPMAEAGAAADDETVSRRYSSDAESDGAAVSPRYSRGSFRRSTAVYKPFERLYGYVTQINPATIPPDEQTTLREVIARLEEGLATLKQRLNEGEAAGD